MAMVDGDDWIQKNTDRSKSFDLVRQRSSRDLDWFKRPKNTKSKLVYYPQREDNPYIAYYVGNEKYKGKIVNVSAHSRRGTSGVISHRRLKPKR